jgi:ribosomal protein S18 acetylase RimI-like enzyme
LTGERFLVRAMPRTAEAVLEATACVVDGGWGNYRQFHPTFAFYASNRRSRTFIARDDQGRVAATSAATRYGHTGWIGHVFVRPELREHGLGKRMTAVAIAHLKRSACDSIVLVSTELGLPLYERLGFKIESYYHELRGTALPRTVELAPYRPLMRSDRAALSELDRRVFGDVRGSLPSRFEDYAWGVSKDGILAGAAIGLPWGGAWAALLPGAGDAATAAMLRLIRTVGSLGPEVILYPPDENRQALDLLRDSGFEELRRVPRMVLGKRSEWLPAAVWSPMSLGLG